MLRFRVCSAARCCERNGSQRWASRLIAGLLLGVAAPIVCAAQSPGQKIFSSECANCHQPDGAGAVGLAPPLRDSLKPYLASAEGRGYLAQIVVSGMAGPIKSNGQMWNGVMPNFRQHSDAELAATLAYVLQQFNGVAANDPALPTAAQIAEARQRAPTPGATRTLRQQLRP